MNSILLFAAKVAASDGGGTALIVDEACGDLEPLVRLIKLGVIPLIQAAIIVTLIVLLIIDLGKAVMAGKEDEIKSAQKLAIKRVIYALVVFLVPWIVNVAIGLLSNTEINDLKGNASQQNKALNCWTKVK